jgi:hypothetical protein
MKNERTYRSIEQEGEKEGTALARQDECSREGKSYVSQKREGREESG